MRKLLSVIVSCCLAATAFGDLVWDNGDIDEANGLCCQRVGAVPVADEADDFHTDQTWTITGAYWETVGDTGAVHWALDRVMEVFWLGAAWPRRRTASSSRRATSSTT